jgi:hypothetical protein
MSAAHSPARSLRWAPLFLLLGFLGCAAPRIDWAGRIGSYTYDQAVLELGPPDKQARVEDGTVVADWLTQRGRMVVYGTYGYPYCFYGPVYPPYFESYSFPDYYLRLIFGPDGRLKTWKKYAR